ncbi:unnamed protein product [Peniophora sp. CBMAI 1063]|nr:unnamed protein product [Peniophora sp. CBMAI 1063]
MPTRPTTGGQTQNSIEGTTNPRNLGDLWNVALQHHEEETGTKLLESTIAKDFPLHPAASEEVLAIFAAQGQSFEAFRARGRKVLQVLKPTVHFICLFIDTGAEAGLATVPGGKAIFVAIGVLLQATKGVSGLYDVIEHLFRKIASYLNRVPIYLNSSTQPAPVLMTILVNTCIQVLEVLAMTTKYCDLSTKSVWGAVSRRTKDYLREFIGGSEVKTALEKLEHLTNAELLAAVAQTNTIARDVQLKIHFVANEAVLRGLREWIQPPNAQPLNWEKKRHLDSCRWFFDGKFESWKTQQNGVYWIYGNAGAGKSVLCSSIIETLKADPALSLVYFYFDFGDTTKQDCRALAASLVFQLATCSEACQSYLRQQQTATSPTYDELLVMLSSLVKLAGHVYIIIDALDECPEQERDKGSSRFLKHLCELDVGEKDFHLLVTSRPEADIWVLLSSVTHILSLNDDQQHLEDVSAYITSRLDRNEYRWSPDVKERVYGVLNERSNGMFLWVDLQLLRLKGCISIADVECALNELPSDLQTTYTRILERSDPSKASVERRRRVFQCIAAARRPLRLAEVVAIYCMDYESRTPLVPIEDFENFILESCPGLLSIAVEIRRNRTQRKSVQFIHFSAKEYLMSAELENAPTLAHHYGFDDYSANVTLAKICLSALDLDTTLPNLTAYASRYWTEHVTSRNEDDLSDRLETFLRTGSPSFARWVSSHNDGHTHGGDTAFHCAARLNLCHHVEKMLALPWSNSSSTESLIMTPGMHAGSALHGAAVSGHVEMCRLLLGHGALIDATDEEGDTPLHDAAARGHLVDVVHILLEYPAVDSSDATARCRARNMRRKTPLHRAAFHGETDVCRLLLSHGAVVEDVDERGDTAVQMALEGEYLDVARMLFEHRAKGTLQVLPFARKARETLRGLVKEDADEPWQVILEEFASQLEDPGDGSTSD